MEKILEKIQMLNETELKILVSFFPESKNITLKKIMEKTGLSYEPVNRNVGTLVKRNLVQESKVGKTLVYSIDLNKIHSGLVYYHYAFEKMHKFIIKEPTIQIGLSELPLEDLDFYAVFGSIAKGTSKKDSDIDVLIVSSNPDKIKTSIESIKRRHNLRIHPVIIPRTEFAKIKKENPEFWQDLVNYGIIFKGAELFYYYAYEKE